VSQLDALVPSYPRSLCCLGRMRPMRLLRHIGTVWGPLENRRKSKSGRSRRMVGNPSFIGFGKSCPSVRHNPSILMGSHLRPPRQSRVA
jgi:hypothetical protein